jgi:hypothetical protein
LREKRTSALPIRTMMWAAPTFTTGAWMVVSLVGRERVTVVGVFMV